MERRHSPRLARKGAPTPAGERREQDEGVTPASPAGGRASAAAQQDDNDDAKATHASLAALLFPPSPPPLAFSPSSSSTFPSTTSSTSSALAPVRAQREPSLVVSDSEDERQREIRALREEKRRAKATEGAPPSSSAASASTRRPLKARQSAVYNLSSSESEEDYFEKKYALPTPKTKAGRSREASKEAGLGVGGEEGKGLEGEMGRLRLGEGPSQASASSRSWASSSSSFSNTASQPAPALARVPRPKERDTQTRVPRQKRRITISVISSSSSSSSSDSEAEKQAKKGKAKEPSRTVKTAGRGKAKEKLSVASDSDDSLPSPSRLFSRTPSSSLSSSSSSRHPPSLSTSRPFSSTPSTSRTPRPTPRSKSLVLDEEEEEEVVAVCTDAEKEEPVDECDGELGLGLPEDVRVTDEGVYVYDPTPKKRPVKLPSTPRLVPPLKTLFPPIPSTSTTTTTPRAPRPRPAPPPPSSSSKPKPSTSSTSSSSTAPLPTRLTPSSRSSLPLQLIRELDRTVFRRRWDGLKRLPEEGEGQGGKGLPDGVEVVWNNRLRNTAGRASWKVSKHSSPTRPSFSRSSHTAIIELATKVTDTEEKLKHTLAHELCHLAAWSIEGEMRPPHGRAFKLWGARVMKVRPDIAVTTTHAYEIVYKYRWKCVSAVCGRIFGRHSKSIDPKTHGCPCGARLVQIDKDGNVKPSASAGEGEGGMETPQKKKKSVWQDFMASESPRVRLSNPSMPQSEVLKVVAERWRVEKQKQAGEGVVGVGQKEGKRGEKGALGGLEEGMRELGL
ncbi:hypothetical protein JCM8547_004102 [Rhodosporidiobolus lusitaniae]